MYQSYKGYGKPQTPKDSVLEAVKRRLHAVSTEFLRTGTALAWVWRNLRDNYYLPYYFQRV